MRLQDLIIQRKADLNVTWDRMVEKAAASGHPIGRSMFHHYAQKEWPNVPTTDAIQGIAAALDLEPDDVLSAAAESVGIERRDVRKGHRTAAMIALLDDRSPGDQAALETALRAILQTFDERDRASAEREQPE